MMPPTEIPASFGSDTAVQDRVSTFLRGVYGWMCVGLGVTAGVAFAVASNEQAVQTLTKNPILFFGLIIAQLGLVVFLTARVAKLSASTASILFVGYSALTGVTLSLVLLAYTGESVASTFFVCGAMFGGTALYGTVTKRSLAGVGQFAFMGLFGLLGAMLVGMFWQNDTLQGVIPIIGVIVFTLLTAWDAQRLKAMALAIPEGQAGSYTVVGALSLYLNFINLFLMLLRLFGNRR